MIAASEPQEYVPFGRQKIKHHPGIILPPLNQGLFENPLSPCFNQDQVYNHHENERWLLRELPLSEGEAEVHSEEELYVSGRTAVWSRGNVGCSVANCGGDQPAGRTLHCCYTMESPVTHALWVNFIKPGPNNAETLMPSICLLDDSKVNVYTRDGEDFLSGLQFKVKSAWSIKFGLLLERVAAPSQPNLCDNNLATLFSLLHPLDEMSPLLIMKSGGTLQYMNESNLRVVFTSEDPSLVVLFDSNTGLHSLWKLRKCTLQESQVFCGADLSTMTTSIHFSGTSQISSNSTRTSMLNKSFTPATPDTSMAFLFNPMESIPRIQSPVDRFRSLTGVKSSVSSGSVPRSGASSLSAMEARLGSSQLAPDGAGADPWPIEPQLTLDHVWTEYLGVPVANTGEAEQAQKAFLTTDILGQTYLGYLLKSKSQLVMAKLSCTNEKDPGFLVGLTTSFSAKDAIPLPGLSMLAVLENSGAVLLYTGTTHIGKVMVGGIMASLASSSYLTCASTGFLQSPYPNRTSLLSSTRMGEALFDERVHLLSPVMNPDTGASNELASGSPVTQDAKINALRDSVYNQLTLEFRNGSMFRISLPEVSVSPLVERCLNTLKSVLPREAAMSLVARWYTARNAPGTQDINPAFEWQLFSNHLLGALGYDVSKLKKPDPKSDSPDTPVQVKKKRGSDLGSPEDWIYLLSSERHRLSGLQLCSQLSLTQTPSSIQPPPNNPSGGFNTEAPLFQYMHSVLYFLHLLYEELKLNVYLSESLPMLGSVLQQLARDLRLPSYVVHYWKDFPSACPIENCYTQLEEDKVPKPIVTTSDTPACLFSHLFSLLRRWTPHRTYPYVAAINPKSGEIIQLVGLLCNGEDNINYLLRPVNVFGSQVELDKTPFGKSPGKSAYTNVTEHCVYLLSTLGYTKQDLTSLPAGIALVLNDAVHRVRDRPPADWPEPAYRLIGRQDLAATPARPGVGERPAAPPPAVVRSPPDADDGMDTMDREILKLRFNKDQRVEEVRRLLQSSHPVTIAIVQRPDVSDHEFIEEQEKHLYTICTRTMALPVGRGMLTLHTASPVPSEPLPVPRLCLSGRAPPRGTTVDLTHIDIVPNMNLWPLFHNGVAAGLRITPNASDIHTAWIGYNKPKGGPEALPEHAGFLMALGLNGHLTNLAQPFVCDYLSRCHEMTSIGVLLGISATKRGTMDLETTKMLSVHIECLLPPTSVELDIGQNVQVAALLSIGLLYQATGHRHMTEILLAEMGRPPGPEMENSIDRESYALAAGLGLGMVVLGKGSDDSNLADALHYYMVGGHKRPFTGSQKEKYKSPAYQIREGDCVNIAVTSPGATLALAMMYFNSGNKAVAQWMTAPDTQYLLDFVCPDALLLRTLARGLILWEEVEPSADWVESHVPPAIRPYCLVKPRPGQLSDNIDLETMNQAYCNILAGACMAMGMRFAGSCNEEAFHTLLHFCKMITSLSGKSIAELAGKSTIEACLNVIVISLAMVMAGSGDLEVMRVCRYLHGRVGQPTVTYGSHLATHMALGLLFLGGGRYTLATGAPAVAALLCAFFPKFPTHSNDNRYHLQAFRHLYVLAAESRLLLPRDIDTGSLCYAHITVLYLDSPHYKAQSCALKAPCILPELKLLKEVRIEDDRYWRVTFRRNENWSQLQNMLTGYVGVKQRAGCLSYLDDPHGFRSLLAQTLTTTKALAWTVPPESIFSYSSDASTINLAHHFLEHQEGGSYGGAELQLLQFLTKIVYECVIHDKIAIIPIWITVIQTIQSLGISPSGHLVWQLKLLLAHGQSPCDSQSVPCISPDMALSIGQHVNALMNSWESELSEVMCMYLLNQPLTGEPRVLHKLAAYLIFHDFPSSEILSAALSDGNLNPLMLHLLLGPSVPISTVQKLSELLNTLSGYLNKLPA